MEHSLKNRYVSTATAAKLLNLHPVYLRFLIRSKRVKARKVLGRYRIFIEDINEILAGEF